MGFSNLPKFPEIHTGFQFLRCTKFDIPNSSGKYQKPPIHLSLVLDFYFGNSCDADKSTLYVLCCPYLVHSCASDVIWWMAKHYCQVRAGLGPRLQRHKRQVRAGLGLRLLWVNVVWARVCQLGHRSAWCADLPLNPDDVILLFTSNKKFST